MAQGSADQLVSSTDSGAEKSAELREPEYISVNQFPTRLFFVHGFVVQFHVARKVVLEDAQENDRQECRKEENQNKRVDNGKPMDFKGRWQES